MSIEARTGVTTGIAAADRARPIAVAVDAANDADAIVTPGHVFPWSAETAECSSVPATPKPRSMSLG